MAKPKKQVTRGRFRLTWIIVVAVVAALVVGVNVTLFVPLGTVMNNTFLPKVVRSAALTAHTKELTEAIEAEGIVLLKNEKNALPLAAEGRKVNVFGWSSTNPIYGGTGSGAVDVSTATNLIDGLQSAGIEVNPQLTAFYTKFRKSRPSIELRAQDWTVPEPTVADFEKEGLLDGAKAYSDTALFVVARSGGEGADLARSLPDVDDIKKTKLPDGRVVNKGTRSSEYADDRDADKSYLQLSNREQALLKKLTAEFSKVIIVVNASNAMELGWLDDAKIAAAVWIGGPGESGFRALGSVLTGAVNPSGRTVDTYLRDLKKDVTWGNFGNFEYTGSDNFHFVNYREGIYVGYRFYETYYLGNEAGYRSAVVFPFGYGLSYTTFSQKLGTPKVEGENVSVDVEVTNTGAVAGKDVVQLYQTAPYAEGGIEKAHVVLLGFAKTKVLQPGEAQSVSLAFSLEDLASYDQKNAKAYVLEAGTYQLKLMKNAHEVWESKNLTVGATVVYGADHKRATDKVAAVNRFDFAEGDLPYLSRAKRFANYAEVTKPAENKPLPPEVAKAAQDALALPQGGETPVQGAHNGLKLSDLAGKAYDDPAWDKLLDQLTQGEMVTLVSLGGYQTKPVASVDKPATLDIDGPQGLSSFMGASRKAGAYTSAIVLAASWNTDLAKSMGESVGYEALEMGVAGWYAPAMNIHRNAFAGRNFEYYSEDGLLSAKFAAALVAGTKSKGLYTYIKHFALNDQETNRNSKLLTWADEQSIREIYLKPFELSVKEGGATAVMSSFNYVGPVWAGASSTLLNDVLRQEWGFRGMVITDYFGAYGYMDADVAVANGNDLMLSTLGMFGATPDASDTPAGKRALRNASKNILYTIANSNAVYSVEKRNELLKPVGGHVSEVDGVAKFASSLGLQVWMLIAIAADVVAAALVAFWIVVLVRKYKTLPL